jgi:hypothetical protein
MTPIGPAIMALPPRDSTYFPAARRSLSAGHRPHRKIMPNKSIKLNRSEIFIVRMRTTVARSIAANFYIQPTSLGINHGPKCRLAVLQLNAKQFMDAIKPNLLRSRNVQRIFVNHSSRAHRVTASLPQLLILRSASRSLYFCWISRSNSSKQGSHAKKSDPFCGIPRVSHPSKQHFCSWMISFIFAPFAWASALSLAPDGSTAPICILNTASAVSWFQEAIVFRTHRKCRYWLFVWS